jgi:hypothetical protein
MLFLPHPPPGFDAFPQAKLSLRLSPSPSLSPKGEEPTRRLLLPRREKVGRRVEYLSHTHLLNHLLNFPLIERHQAPVSLKHFAPGFDAFPQA